MLLRRLLLPIFAVANLLFLASTAKSTTIAAVVTPDKIVLAADSLVTKLSDMGPVGFTQKIEDFGSTVVAAGGLGKVEGNVFDVFQVVSGACRNLEGANAQAQVFANLMRAKLPTVVTALQKESQKTRTALPPKLNSTVWFCGIEDRHPVIYAVDSEIGLGVQSQSKIAIRRFPPEAASRGGGVVFLGPDSLRGRTFQLNPRRLKEVPYLVATAGEIVRTGISDPNGHSGGAVTIFHISREGHRLISRS